MVEGILVHVHVMQLLSYPLFSDALIQLAVDSSRQILYTRSEKNTIQVHIVMCTCGCTAVVCYSKCSTPQYHPYCVVYRGLSLLQVFDLGRDGCGLSQVTSISMETIVQKATAALRLV